jgi:hypothetical protein
MKGTRIARALLAACALFGTGCGTSRAVGLSDASFLPKQTRPLVCIQAKDGRTAKLVEGEAGGHPAVRVDGLVLGYSATLDQPVDVAGSRVFAGQECQWGGIMGPRPVCSGAIVEASGEQRVVVYWMRFLTSPDLVVDSVPALLAERGQTLGILRQINLDGPTFAAFSELASSRGKAATERTSVMVAGAVAVGAGETAKKDKVVKAGAELMSVGQGMSIDDDDRPHVEKHPALAPVFQALHDVTVVCVAGPPAG